VVPAISAKKNAKGGYLVLRPDSGDPTEAVLMALVAADKVRMALQLLAEARGCWMHNMGT
jgi:nicotinic acid phosphoribosyltransferase